MVWGPEVPPADRAISSEPPGKYHWPYFSILPFSKGKARVLSALDYHIKRQTPFTCFLFSKTTIQGKTLCSAHTYTHTHTRTHTYAHNKDIYRHTHIHAHRETHMYTHTHRDTHTYAHRVTNTYTQTHKHTYRHTYTQRHRHTLIYTYIHKIHTHTRSLSKDSTWTANLLFPSFKPICSKNVQKWHLY